MSPPGCAKGEYRKAQPEGNPVNIAIDWDHEPSPQALQAALQAGLPGFAEGHLAIEALRVLKRRRSSSHQRHPHPITLCLELDVHEPGHSRRGVQRLYGKAYRAGASAPAFAQARQAPLAAAEFGAALAHLPALDMLWWAWPNDPGLPQLPLLLDPARLQQALPTSLRDSGHRVLGVQTLRHEPEQRATLCCTLQTPTGLQRPIYGKTFADGRGAVIHQRFEQLWPLAEREPTAAWVARPLGYDAGSRTLWQAAAPGQPLLSLQREAELIDALGRVGAALAHLHGQPPETGEARSVAHWLQEIARRRQKIARVLPELANRVAALAQQLVLAAQALPPARGTLIHGDFHPEQVWMHEGRVVLFDFDEFALGNPMEDLAAFVTRLHQLPGSSAMAEARAGALLQGYRRATLGHWQPGWLDWHLALQSLLQASRAYIFQVPGWQADLAGRLARAEQLAQALTGAHA